jgi:hypothetical protein
MANGMESGQALGYTAHIPGMEQRGIGRTLSISGVLFCFFSFLILSSLLCLVSMTTLGKNTWEGAWTEEASWIAFNCIIVAIDEFLEHPSFHLGFLMGCVCLTNGKCDNSVRNDEVLQVRYRGSVVLSAINTYPTRLIVKCSF